MDLNTIFKAVIGPYGALFLLLAGVVYLWRRLEQQQAVNTRQQDLFEEALKVINSLVPLVRDSDRKR